MLVCSHVVFKLLNNVTGKINKVALTYGGELKALQLQKTHAN